MMRKVGADDFITRRHATSDDLDRLPRVNLWPELAPDALYGLAGRIVTTVDPFTEADPVATLAQLLTGIGNLIGPGPHARVQFDHHPLRFNVALVGATSKGRKGTSWSPLRYLFTQLDPEWVARRATSGLSSGEGLIHHVRDARHELRPVKENGRTVDHELVIVDHGEHDKRLFIVEPELAATLKVMNRESNVLSAVIREAWDSGALSTLTKTSPERATGAHVSIIGHITQEEARRYLTETERANGFANRFLWLLVRRSKVLPEGGAVPRDLLAPLLEDLKRVVTFGRHVEEISRDSEARAIWNKVYEPLSGGEPGMVGAMTARAEAQVLRLAVAYAVLDCSPLVRLPHLLAALALWDHAEASVRRIFGTQLGWPIADLLLNALRARGPMTETEITSKVFRGHGAAAEIDAALEALLERGLVERQTRHSGGRPAVVWEAMK